MGAIAVIRRQVRENRFTKPLFPFELATNLFLPSSDINIAVGGSGDPRLGVVTRI